MGLSCQFRSDRAVMLRELVHQFRANLSQGLAKEALINRRSAVGCYVRNEDAGRRGGHRAGRKGADVPGGESRKGMGDGSIDSANGR